MQLHNLLLTLRSHLRLDLFRQRKGKSAFLIRIGERTQPVEFDFPDKIVQFPELPLPFSRMTDDQRGAQGHIGHLRADRLDQFVNGGFCFAAPHHAQHFIADVLQRQVDVRQNLVMVAHQAQNFRGEIGGVPVQNAQPLHAVHLRQTFH